MSNGINSPKEDIKKYDSSFLSSPKSPIVIRQEDVSIEDNAASSFGFGYTEDELNAERLFKEQQEKKSQVDYSMSGIEKASRSFVAGIGDLVEGLADAVDYFDSTPDSRLTKSEIASGISKDVYGMDINTPISDSLHGFAEHLQSYADSVEEYKVEDISFGSMFDLDFWSTHAARAIPFSLSFFIPGIGGARAASMGYKALSASSKITKGFRAGRSLNKLGLVSTAEKGSKLAQAAAGFTGGMVAGNLSEGAIIAGQVYNDAIEQGLNEKQASVAAHDTYVDNAKWMFVDGVQLMGVMGLPKFLRTVLPTKQAKALGINNILKPGIKSVVKNMGAAGGVFFTDSMLEQFQEVYQDWSSKSNIAEQQGKEFMPYMDYFFSQEALPTRVIAFATSGLVGGAKTFIDVSAERKRAFDQKYIDGKKFLVSPNPDVLEQTTDEFELTKREVGDEYTPGLSSTKRLEGMKENQLMSLLVFRALDGKLDYYQQLIEHHKEQGNITDQQYNDYMATSKDVEELVKNTPSYNLNRNEKARLIIAQQFINENKNKIQNNVNELKAEIEKINASDIPVQEKEAQVQGVQARIEEVESGNIELQDEEGNVMTDKEGNVRTIRQENEVHRQEIQNIYTESKARKERERVEQEVKPKIKTILDKEDSKQALTEDEQKVKEEEKNIYDREKSIRTREKAQEKVGKAFVYNSSQTKEDGSLVFDKKTTKGNKTTITRKTVAPDGSVQTETITPNSVKEETTKEAKKRAEKKPPKSKSDNETYKSKYLKDGYHKSVEDDEVRNKINQKQAETNALRQEKLFGNVSLGDLKVWAKSLEAENPFTMVFFDESLKTDFGYDAIGKAVGLSIFINPLLAEQEVFHHELWHVYQRMFSGTKEMKRLLKEIVKQPIFEETKLKNLNYIRVKKGDAIVQLRDLIADPDSNVISLQEYVSNLGLEMDSITNTERTRYLSDIDNLLQQEGHTILPNSQQKELQDEALAIAGGYQDTGDRTVFVQAPAKQRKIKSLFNAVWSKIKKSSDEKTAGPLLASQYPDFYDNNFAIMLRNFRNEAAKGANNKISWSTYKKMQPGYLASRRNSKIKNKALTQIEQSIPKSQILNDIIQRVKDKYEQTAGSLLMASDMGEAVNEAAQEFSNLSTEIVRDVLIEAKSSVIEKPSVIDRIDYIYDNFPGIIEGKIKHHISKQVNEIIQDEADLKDISFGRLINDDLRRGVNDRVTAMVNNFVAQYNENNPDSKINKDVVMNTIDDNIDVNRFDSEAFIEASKGVILRNQTDEEKIFKQFVDYVKSDLVSPGAGYDSVLNNIYQYFKGFRHEKVFQFNLSSDNQVFVEEKLPKKLSTQSAKILDSLIKRNAKNPDFMPRIVSILLQARDNIQGDKKAHLVNLFNKILLEEGQKGIVDNKINTSDLGSMRIEGMLALDYFSTERIEEILNFFTDINFDKTLETRAKRLGEQVPESIDAKKEILISFIGDAYKNSKAGAYFDGKEEFNLFINKIQERIDNYYNLTEDERKASRPVSFNIQDFNSEAGYRRNNKNHSFNINYADEKIKSVLSSMQTSLAYKEGKRNVLGQVQDPNNNLIGTFNKSSYLYDSIEVTKDYFRSLALDESADGGKRLPQRLTDLYGSNPYALGLFRSTLSPSELASFRIKQDFIFEPEVSYMSGYYDARAGERKGYSSNRIKPGTFTALKIMHIFNAIKNKQKTYKHYMGQAGDSGRHYFINNALIGSANEIARNIDLINKESNNVLNPSVYNAKINELFAKLVSEGYLKNNASNRRVFKMAYMTNAINKYYLQDLYLNKSAAITNESFLIDHPKRFKGMTSPRIPLEDGVRILPIIFEDPEVDITLNVDGKDVTLSGVQMADSESFMLPEHQQLLQNKFGELNDIGNNMKGLYYGQNLDNKAFEDAIGGRKRVPIYLKSHHQILSDSFVRNKEMYRAFESVLKEITANLEGENVIPIFFASSSIKGGLTKDEIKSISFTPQEIASASDDIIFLNKQTDTNKLELYESDRIQKLKSLEEKIDRIYRFTDENKETVYGFDGRNYGIQTLLDNQNRTAAISKQKIAAYNIYETIESFESGNFENGKEAILGIKQALAELIQLNYQENFEGKNFDDIFADNEAVIRNFADRYVAKKYGPEYVGNEDIINRVVTSSFKNDVMTLVMQGTFSTEMSDIGYNIAFDKTVEDSKIEYSDNLKSYSIVDGQVVYPEIIMPAYAKTMGVKEGDLVMATRIPHSKPGDSPIYQVREFNAKEAGNAVIISSLHANLIGSDKDGDGLHINIRNSQDNLNAKQQAENNYFDSVVKLFNEPEVHKIVMQPIDFTEDITNKGLNHIKNVRKEDVKENTVDLYLDEEEMIQDRFLGNFIGIIASMNRTFNYFAKGTGSDATIMYVNSYKNKFGRANIKVENKRIDRIANIKEDGEQLWLTYAKAANFIIDDTKFGNRAKFGIIQETANDFFLLLRMGIPLTSVIDLMYHPNYKSYIQGKANGLSNKQAILSAYEDVNPDTIGFADLTRDVNISLDSKKTIPANDLYQLVETLSSFAKDIRVVQELVNLDQEVPSNTLSILALEKQLEETLTRQKRFNQIFDEDPYLSAHRDMLFNKFKPKVLERSLVSEAEGKRILDTLGRFVDLTNKDTVNLISNTLQFYKLGLELPQNVYNDKSFQSLYLAPLNEIDAIEQTTHAYLIENDFIKQEYKKFTTEEYSFIKASEVAKDLLIEAQESGNLFANAITFYPVSSIQTYVTERNQYKDKAYEVYRFDFNYDAFQSLTDEKDIIEYQRSFNALPQNLKDFFVGYEYFVNKFGLGSSNSLRAFLPNTVNKKIKDASKRIKKGSEAIDIAQLLQRFENTLSNQIPSQYQDIKSTVLLLELLANYNPTRFRNTLNTFRSRDIVDTFFSASQEKGMALKKPSFVRESDGLLKFEINLSSLQTIEDAEDLKPVPLKPIELNVNTDFTELNVLKHFNENLNLETKVKKIRDGGMYLSRVADLTEGRLGKETEIQEENFFRLKGFLKDNVSYQDFLEIESYETELRKARNSYSQYLEDLKVSEGLRQRMIEQVTIPRIADDFSEDYFLDLQSKVSKINRDALNLDELAKQNLTKELYYRYAQAVTQAQIKKWKSTEEGRKLFKRLDYKQNQDKDISVASMWYSPGDFGQYYPTLAGVRRTLELENMRMHRDMRKIQTELNDAYNALFKSKYGLASFLVKGISSTPLLNIAYSNPTVASNLFKNIQTQRSYLKKNEEGNYEYISETKLNEKYFTEDNFIRLNVKDTNTKVRDVLSKEEYRYAEMISKFTIFYAELIQSKIDKNELNRNFETRAYYTPLKTASLYETFKRRGIYGLYYHSIDGDYIYNNVVIDAYNPLTGEKEKMPYRDFKAIYSTTDQEIQQFEQSNPTYKIDKDKFTQVQRTKALRSAKRQAAKLYDSGVDALGNDIEVDSGEMQAIDAEQTNMNRYISKRSQRASYFAGNNLHHAMYSYLKAMVFQFGTAYEGQDKKYRRLAFKTAEDDVYGKSTIVSTPENLSQKQFANLEGSVFGGKNFEGFEKQKFLVQSAKYLMHTQNKGNAARYLDEVVLDRFIGQAPKKTFTPFEKRERQLADILTKWTMYIGLGLNFPAAIANVAIGKYNSFRSQGGRDSMLGIARFFGVDDLRNGKFDNKAVRKAKKMLDEFGILTYRPEEQLEGISADTWFDKIFFFPMTSAEFFIQSTQFLGEITEEEYNAYYLDEDNNLQIREGAKAISADRLASITRRIQNTQGRGYSDLDQRLIQVYALSNMTLQFKRWLPTYLVDRLGKAGYKTYIDDFGNIYSGSITASARNLKSLVGMESLKNLNTGDKEGIERFRRGAAGVALVGMLLLALGDEDEENLKALHVDLERLIGDQLLLVNPEDWKYLLSVPGLATLENMIMLILGIATQDTYTRDAKYGVKGELKAKRRVAGLLPAVLRGGLEREQTRGQRARAERRKRDKRRERSTR